MVVRIASLVLAAARAGGETKVSRRTDLRLHDLDISRRPPCDGSRLQHLRKLCEHTVVTKFSCWYSERDTAVSALSSDCGKSSLSSIRTFLLSALTLFLSGDSVLPLHNLYSTSFWGSARTSIRSRSVLHMLESLTSFASATDKCCQVLQT